MAPRPRVLDEPGRRLPSRLPKVRQSLGVWPLLRMGRHRLLRRLMMPRPLHGLPSRVPPEWRRARSLRHLVLPSLGRLGRLRLLRSLLRGQALPPSTIQSFSRCHEAPRDSRSSVSLLGIVVAASSATVATSWCLAKATLHPGWPLSARDREPTKIARACPLSVPRESCSRR